jgi:hypothetical protein
VVSVRALTVAFHAHWSEGDIFGARDCAKWRAQKYYLQRACELLERPKYVYARYIGGFLDATLF